MAYSTRHALKSLWFDKWINLLTSLTIGTGLFILGFIAFTLSNIEGITKRLPERFSITVFLSDTVRESDINRINTVLKKDSIIKKISYISKDKALEELRTSLKDAAYILEGLDENPLFPSLVIRLKRSGFDRRRVEKLIYEIRSLKGVEDVVYGEELLGSIHTVHRGVRAISAGLIILFSTAITFVCYSTVKILLNRRKEEIDIYKLLGATRGFIRKPFLIEGSTLGLFGGIFGGLGIYGLYSLFSRFISSDFPIFMGIQFPIELIIALPVTGFVLGVIGSTIAIGRLRF